MIDWSGIARFFVGSWIYDQFTDPEEEEKPGAFTYILVLVRLAVIGVLAYVVYKAIIKKKRR